MDREEEIVELEVRYMTDLPAGSSGIISDIPFLSWKEPEPLTKADMDKLIEDFKRNPNMFKDLGRRWY